MQNLIDAVSKYVSSKDEEAYERGVPEYVSDPVVERQYIGDIAPRIIEAAVSEFNKKYYNTYNVGDMVRLKQEVEKAKTRYGYAMVERGSIGTIWFIDGEDGKIRFPEVDSWTVYLPQMEVVEKKYDPFRNGITIPEIRTFAEYEDFIESTINTLEEEGPYYRGNSEYGTRRIEAPDIFSSAVKLAEQKFDYHLLKEELEMERERTSKGKRK